MKRKNILIAGFVIIVTVAFLIQLFNTPFFYRFLSHPQKGELNFQVIPVVNPVKKGEVFKVYLILTNVGAEKVNVWKLENHASYDLSFSYTNGTEIRPGCVSTRIQLTNDDLVELDSGLSLVKMAKDTSCWDLSRGEYILRDRKSTRLNSSHTDISRMPSSA